MDLKLNVGYTGMNVGIGKNGEAAKCLELLGGGLSKDQLRWIYSSFNTRELIGAGWNPSSVPFLDNDDNKHLWSEIHENCTDTPIILAAEQITNDQQNHTVAIAYLYDHILTGRGEVMRDYFSSNDRSELDEYLRTNGAAISIFHLYDVFDKEYQDRDIVTISISKKNGMMYIPTAEIFERGLYPLMKKFFLAVVNDPQALEYTRPLLEFGYSTRGTDILKGTGYWPIQESEKIVMYSLINSTLGVEVHDVEEHCGREDAKLTIGGSETVLPVMQIWSDVFRLYCPLDVTIEEGGSTIGASGVCSSSDSGASFDIGMMSRDFDPVTEAVPRPKKNFVYDCLVADDEKPRSVVQIDIALDGITIMFAIGSIGEKCVRLLGGLTMDQLRWMYSSYSDSELEDSGWDPECLSNNDFDSETHFWSELDSRCPDEEIRLTGDYWGDGSFTSFSKLVLKDYANGEHIANNRPKSYLQATGTDYLTALLDYEDAVSYIGYHYYLQNQDIFWAAPLATDTSGIFVAPSQDSIADGSYPLTRSIFVNVLNDAQVLQDTTALFELGFTHQGLLRTLGFAPIVGDQMEDMLSRLRDGPYESSSQGDDEKEKDVVHSFGLILGISAAVVLVGLIIVAFILFAPKTK